MVTYGQGYFILFMKIIHLENLPTYLRKTRKPL